MSSASKLEEIKKLLPDNNNGEITEAKLRESFEKTFSEMDTKATKEALKKVEDKVKAGTPTPTPSVNNKLAGKKISFVGDSITNFGDTSKEYKTATGYTFDDTWVGQFLQLTGGTKGKIDAISGTTMQAITLDGGAIYNTTLGRVELLPEDSDYIFVFMGANDQKNDGNQQGHKLGTIRPKGTLGNFDNSNPNFLEFTGAYQLYLEKILKRHAKAEVVLMTPLKAFGEGNETDLNKASDQYAERVIEIAKLYGLKWIDTREAGFTNYNHQLFFSDGLHPNKAGHRKLARLVAEKVLEFGILGKLNAADYYTKAEIDEKLKALPKGNGSTSSGDIVIGGANLLKNTALPMFTPNGQGTGNPTIMSDTTGSFVRYTPDADKVVSTYGLFLEGSNLGNHSRSMDFRHNHTSNVTLWGQSIPPNKWTRVKQEKFTNSSGWCSFASNIVGVAIDIRNYKIELGSKATDWTPNILEYNLGVSDTMVDTVLPWTHDLEVVGEINGTNDRVIYKLPRIESIAEILEFRLIQRNGTVTEIKGLKVITTSTGRKGVALKSAEIGDPVKVYVKALLK
jgi:hypothetical protein|nr:MAG TPA: GDSL like Lipase Acylhydrolase [Caudoviricetes sp.]